MYAFLPRLIAYPLTSPRVMKERKSGDEVDGWFWGCQKFGSREYYTLGERNIDPSGTMDGEVDDSVANEASIEYRTYKRRWIGLVTLTLMNIVVSWNVR